MSKDAINQIVNDAVFRHGAKETIDGITGSITILADAGISKPAAVELLIGMYQTRGLYHLSGVIRVVAGEVYIKKAKQERREKVAKLFGKLFLR